MTEQRTITIVRLCDFCGEQVEDTFDPVNRFEMDYENHDLIPRYWSACSIRDVDGDIRSGQFCSVEHLIAWIQQQVPVLEQVRADREKMWNHPSYRLGDDGELHEVPPPPYPYRPITTTKL